MADVKSKVAIQPSGVINVHVAADVMYNLEKCNAVTKSVLGRLGCPTCHSGKIINFLHEEQQFAVP
jgi:hypothetical protein